MRAGRPWADRKGPYRVAAAPLACLAAAAWAACGGPPPQPTATSGVPEPIRAHLFCFECNEGELDRVVALRRDALPSLEAALRGPPAEYLTGARARLSLIWQRAAEYRTERGEVPGMTEADYIGANLPNFVATVQTRAVQALAAIGGTGSDRRVACRAA